jgi:hypothetical protein
MLPNGTGISFSGLGVRYPLVAEELTRLFIAALNESGGRSSFVSGEIWEKKKLGCSYREAVWVFNSAVRALGIPKPKRCARSVRGRGCELLCEAYMAKQPPWLSSSSMSPVLDHGGAGASDPEGIHPPRLRWMNELVAKVQDGRSVGVEVLPGDGRDEVVRLLEFALKGESVVILPVDLAGIKDGLEFLASLGHELQPEDDATSPTILKRAAASAAGGASRLILIVRGWGAHDRRFETSSLREMSRILQNLIENVHQPDVQVVLLSPIPVDHLPGPSERGSTLNLDTVLFSETDLRQATQWGERWLTGGAEALLAATAGRLDAVRAAVRMSDEPLPKRFQAVGRAHRRAATGILEELGTCCRTTLLGKEARPDCVAVMKEAGILQDNKGPPQPGVAAWAEVWKRAAEVS